MATSSGTPSNEPHPSKTTTDVGTSSDDRQQERNLGRRERIASLLLGGILVARGVRRRSLGGVVTTAAGAVLVARGFTGRSRLYRLLGVNATGEATRRGTGASDRATTADGSVTVGKPAEQLAEFWRDATRLNELVGDAATVVDAGEDRHRWTVDLPLGGSRSWEMRLVEDRPGESLRWESTPDAPVSAEWSVEFRPAPGDRGTEVRLEARFDPPAGALGSTVMDRLGFLPRVLVNRTLHRFRSLVETGEMPTLERNPSARGSGDEL